MYAKCSSGPSRPATCPSRNDGTGAAAGDQARDQADGDGKTKRFRFGPGAGEQTGGQSEGDAGDRADHQADAFATARRRAAVLGVGRDSGQSARRELGAARRAPAAGGDVRRAAAAAGTDGEEQIWIPLVSRDPEGNALKRSPPGRG
jgi:hypothetical protein